MEVTRHRRRANKVVSSSLAELYPHDLQLYAVPPTSCIPLTEFEDLALERLKALRIIEQVSQKGLTNADDWKSAVIAEMKKQGLKAFTRLGLGSVDKMDETDLKARQKDHISHFILRLAYCRSDELQRWFIKQELDLFRLRFQSLSSEGVQSFLEKNHLDYTPISEEEKRKVKDKLIASTWNTTPATVETTNFYKVPFTDVVDLVSGRKVYLTLGDAYIPSTNLISVIQTVFRTHLSLALVMTARHLPTIEEDERLRRFLGGLHNSYTREENYLNRDGNTVTPEQLDSLSKISFPPCMRQLHEAVRANHHLRHGGRMQYGLFLKGIGVTMEDSLRFWRGEFTKKMDLDKFEKQYSYTIRHNYGKEGRRTNYTPYSCVKIIMGSVGPGDYHGCPFKHGDIASLKQKMHSYNLPTIGISEVVDYVHKGHFQLACSKYFELTHGVVLDTAIQHPNQYFELSQKVLAEKHGAKLGSGDAEPVSKGKTLDPSWEKSFDVSLPEM